MREYVVGGSGQRKFIDEEEQYLDGLSSSVHNAVGAYALNVNRMTICIPLDPSCGHAPRTRDLQS